jgi:hypothetical protein
MQTITLTINVPDGTDVMIDQAKNFRSSPASNADPQAIERHFCRYLSSNGRRLFGAVARVQQSRGSGFTFDDVANELSESYSTTLSFHRTTGRAARRWKDETKDDAPIWLEDLTYDWVPEVDGMRTRYEMPSEIAKVVAGLE